MKRETTNPQTASGNKTPGQVPKKKKVSALTAASVGRSATAQVQHHSGAALAGTGTNISYEGATAPGAGGSVGTGEASGKEATRATITTNDDFDQNRGGKPSKGKSKAAK